MFLERFSPLDRQNLSCVQAASVDGCGCSVCLHRGGVPRLCEVLCLRQGSVEHKQHANKDFKKSPPHWHMNALLEVIMNRGTVKWHRKVSRGRKSLFLDLEKESAKHSFWIIRKPGVCFMKSLGVFILFCYHPISQSIFTDLASCCLSFFLFPLCIRRYMYAHLYMYMKAHGQLWVSLLRCLPSCWLR